MASILLELALVRASSCTLYLHMIIDVHMKHNPSTGIHGSPASVTASSLGIVFSYMIHQCYSPLNVTWSFILWDSQLGLALLRFSISYPHLESKSLPISSLPMREYHALLCYNTYACLCLANRSYYNLGK